MFANVPSFHFHICDGSDDESPLPVEFESLTAARIEAVALISEAARFSAKEVVDRGGFSVTITDERGDTVGAVTLSAS